jgi:hypothetical protein
MKPDITLPLMTLIVDRNRMKTSEKLLATLADIHHKLQEQGINPAYLSGWETRLISYISAAVPVALWLESVGHEPTLKQLFQMDEVEDLVFRHQPAYGTIFFAICAPLRQQLQETKHFDVEKLGNQDWDACMHLGYLAMQVFGVSERVVREEEAKRLVNVLATRTARFCHVPDEGWFKADQQGPWLLRLGATRATRLREDGSVEEFTFCDTDPVFVE